MNRGVNYQLINYWGVTIGIKAIALRIIGMDLLSIRS